MALIGRRRRRRLCSTTTTTLLSQQQQCQATSRASTISNESRIIDVESRKLANDATSHRRRSTINTHKFAILFVVFVICRFINEVTSHGRLIEPPSRSSMWRYGFDTPHDYNDHESYCGGFTRQWQRNRGKCGICGDAWDTRTPRAHEMGGKYGNNVIVRRYKTGSVIPVNVELTANHRGYFEFRTCAVTRYNEEVSQECLDEHLLVGDNGTARYYPGEGNRIFEARYKLPDALTCAQCVFQWRYIAGNNWGDCGNGTGAVGCGPQEEFRACADIAIGDNEATLPPLPRPTKRPTTRPTPTTTIPSTARTSQAPAESTESSDYEEPTPPAWIYNFVIAGTCLLVVLAVMALLYAYYYHAGRAKQWLMASRLLARRSEQPLHHQQFYPHHIHHQQQQQQQQQQESMPPIAPPRLKKQHNISQMEI